MNEKENGFYSKYFNYRFNLKAGYFFWKRSSAGIYSGYSYKNTKTTVNDTLCVGHKINEFYIGPYYKKYLKIFNRFSFTIFTSVFFYNYYYKPNSESYYPIIRNSYNLTLIPGLNYNLTDRLSIDLDIGEFSVFIRSFRRKDPNISEEDQKTIIFGTNTSLNKFRITAFKLGFSYRIGKQ